MKRILAMALAMGLTAALTLPAVSDARGAREQTGDVSQYKEKVQKDANLSSSDIDAIEPELREFSQKNADPEQVSGLAKTASENNCTGPCLRESLRAMNSAMSQGFSDSEANNIVTETLRSQVQARGDISPEELGNRIRAEVDQKVAARSGAPGTTAPGMTTPESPAPGETPGGMTEPPSAPAPEGDMSSPGAGGGGDMGTSGTTGGR